MNRFLTFTAIVISLFGTCHASEYEHKIFQEFSPNKDVFTHETSKIEFKTAMQKISKEISKLLNIKHCMKNLQKNQKNTEYMILHKNEIAKYMQSLVTNFNIFIKESEPLKKIFNNNNINVKYTNIDNCYWINVDNNTKIENFDIDYYFTKNLVVTVLNLRALITFFISNCKNLEILCIEAYKLNKRYCECLDEDGIYPRDFYELSVSYQKNVLEMYLQEITYLLKKHAYLIKELDSILPEMQLLPIIATQNFMQKK